MYRNRICESIIHAEWAFTEIGCCKGYRKCVDIRLRVHAITYILRCQCAQQSLCTMSSMRWAIYFPFWREAKDKNTGKTITRNNEEIKVVWLSLLESTQDSACLFRCTWMLNVASLRQTTTANQMLLNLRTLKYREYAMADSYDRAKARRRSCSRCTTIARCLSSSSNHNDLQHLWKYRLDCIVINCPKVVHR